MRTEDGERKAREARAQYNREHIATVSTTMRKEDAEAFKNYAAERGTTASALIKSYIRSCLSKEEPLPVRDEGPRCYVAVPSPEVQELYKGFVAHGNFDLNPNQLVDRVLVNYFECEANLHPKKLESLRRRFHEHELRGRIDFSPASGK